MRALLIGLVVAVVFLALTFAVVSCEPGDSGPQGPGVELDIDMPKQHKKPPTYRAPAPKPPKIGKRR
jgi:hypothetical protein